MKPSKRFRLGILDFLKGLVMSVLGASISVVHTTVENGALNINPDEVIKGAVVAGSAYLIKNLLEDKKKECEEIVENAKFDK